VRISQDRDGTKEGPERQLAACAQYAKDRGWPVADTYCDRDTSAYSNVRRPEYQRMLSDVRSKRIDCILFWRFDRLTRRLGNLHGILELLDQTGCMLVSVTESVDTSTPMGKALLGIVAAMAEQESMSTSRRVKAAVEGQIAKGAVPTGGSRCFGYTDEGVLVAKEATHIRWMTKRYLEGTSFRQLAKALNDKGVATSKGNQWTSKTVGQLLKSPRIGGYRLATDGETLVQGNWKPVLPAPQFSQLREALEQSRRPKARANEPTHLLTGIARCGKCGSGMYGTNWKMAHAGGKAFPRLTCAPDVGRKNCGGTAVSELSIDRLVIREMYHHILNRRFDGRSSTVDYSAVRDKLEADVQAREDLVMAHFVERRIDSRAFALASKALDASIARAKITLSEAGAVELPSLRAMSIGEMDEWWNSQPISAQRALVKSVIDHIVVKPASQRGGNQFDPSRVVIHWRRGFEPTAN
jgi:site-specific DNA recombinase